MIFWSALLICTTGILALFFLDRDKSTRNSKALWLPVAWLWIAGSRPVSSWFSSGGGSAGALASTVDGSPTDAAIFATLLGVGILVVFLRRDRAGTLLKASVPVLIYFAYCLLSITWSPFPEPAFKRWTKDVGDLVMVAILVTDGQPTAALRRFYSRVGFILFPTSILLIRYTDLGRAYDPDGVPMNTGVTTNKNSLGMIVFLVSIGALWNVRALLMNKGAPNRTRRLVAQCTLLSFGIVLLQMAHSATSIACFILGGGLILATGLRAIKTRPARVHALCLGIILVGALTMLSGGESVVTSALGRKENLSGRTDIWKASIASADNALIGTGFESFWNTNVEKVARRLPGYWEIHNLVSAHNGYIQVYLDLGWIGLSLIALILFSGYRHSIRAFRRDPELASLFLAYIATGTIYSITEAGFRVLTPIWIFLLLAVVSANGVTAGLFGGESPELAASRRGTSGSAPVNKNLIPQRENVFTARTDTI